MELQQRIIDLEMSPKPINVESESEEWVESDCENEYEEDMEKFLIGLTTKNTAKKLVKETKENVKTENPEIKETTEKNKETTEKLEIKEITKKTTEKPKPKESTATNNIIEFNHPVKSPNDLLTFRTPIVTNLDSQVHQAPISPKKRIRSLSPPPANNLAPDSSPLSDPAMTDTPYGPGQRVKRKKRKK